MLKPLRLKAKRLARGLPADGDLEYSDSATLQSALSGRRVTPGGRFNLNTRNLFLCTGAGGA
jgi:hypothetical protein